MKTMYLLLLFCCGLVIGYGLKSCQGKSAAGNKAITVTPTQEDLNKKARRVDSLQELYALRLRFQSIELLSRLRSKDQRIAMQAAELQNSRRDVKAALSRIRILKAQQHASLADTLSVPTALLDTLTESIDTQQLRCDSIVETMTQRQALSDALVAVRDTQLLQLRSSYEQLRDLRSEQAREAQRLSEELNTTLKRLNRKRQLNRWLGAGILFIGGGITTYVLQNRH